jgi:multiple sugar transport system permease protein
LSSSLLHLAVAVGALLSVFPFVFMALSSLKTTTEIFMIPPTFIPENPRFDTYQRLFTGMEFGKWYVNSLTVALVTTAGVLFFSSLAGFAFSKYQFPGRGWAFGLLIASTMIPFSLIMMPLFFLVSRQLHWVG